MAQQQELSLLTSPDYEFEVQKTRDSSSLLRQSKRSGNGTNGTRLNLASKMNEDEIYEMSPSSSNASSPLSVSFSQGQSSNLFSAPQNTPNNTGLIISATANPSLINPISPSGLQTTATTSASNQSTANNNIQINLNDGQVIYCAVCGDRATGKLNKKKHFYTFNFEKF